MRPAEGASVIAQHACAAPPVWVSATAAALAAVGRRLRIAAADEFRRTLHELVGKEQLHLRARPREQQQRGDTPA